MQDAFVRKASYGEPPQLAEALRAVPILDEHTRGLVAAPERERVVVARAGDGAVAVPLWDAYGTSSAIIIALMHGPSLVGAQAVAFRDGNAVFGRRHVRRGAARRARDAPHTGRGPGLNRCRRAQPRLNAGRCR